MQASHHAPLPRLARKANPSLQQGLEGSTREQLGSVARREGSSPDPSSDTHIRKGSGTVGPVDCCPKSWGVDQTPPLPCPGGAARELWAAEKELPGEKRGAEVGRREETLENNSRSPEGLPFPN